MRHLLTSEQFQAMQNKVRGTAQRPAMTKWKDTPEANHSPLGKVSGTNLSPRQAPSLYKSKWEAAFASKLELEKKAGLVCNYWYEPFSLWLPGKVRYKPDFLVQYFPTGHTVNRPGFVTTLELIEVKGWSPNRRDGMTRLKIAAAIYSCFVWRLVYRTKCGGWDGEYL